MIISLVGYRGTGKTTVGLLLAERLGWTCVDTDAQIQQRTGRSIRSIFESDGESAFRDLETAEIGYWARQHRIVLSLGGGAILRVENRQQLSVAGPVVWLTAQPDTIRKRLHADPASWSQRPSLLANQATPGANAVLDEIEQVLNERIPLYQSCADLTLATEDRSPAELADAIVAALDLRPERGLS